MPYDVKICSISLPVVDGFFSNVSKGWREQTGSYFCYVGKATWLGLVEAARQQDDSADVPFGVFPGTLKQSAFLRGIVEGVTGDTAQRECVDILLIRAEMMTQAMMDAYDKSDEHNIVIVYVPLRRGFGSTQGRMNSAINAITSQGRAPIFRDLATIDMQPRFSADSHVRTIAAEEDSLCGCFGKRPTR